MDASVSETTACLSVLLDDAVDYAGLFPPAALDLDTSLRSYFDYLRLDAAWMLARYVAPLRRLPELTNHPSVVEAADPLRLAVLGTGGDTASDFLESLDQDASDVASFSDSVKVEVLEALFPRDLLETDVVSVRRFIDELHRVLARHDLSVDVFLEVPLSERMRLFLPIVSGAAAAYNHQRQDPTSGRTGVKIRTGGTEPDHFPEPEMVAYAMAACREAGTRLKATAGLHHAIRHFSEPLGTYMHGFLNVFIAAVMASIHRLNEEDLLSILLEEDSDRFEILTDRIEYGGRKATVDQIARARREGIASFGSCSFLEPVDELRTLGLLARETS